jgi:hypothetical protein
MYDQTYDGMVESGNAIALDEPVHVDREGNIVANERDAFGPSPECLCSR